MINENAIRLTSFFCFCFFSACAAWSFYYAIESRSSNLESVSTEVEILSSDDLNLGLIRQGENIHSVLKVKNNSSLTVRLGNILTSCGCTVVQQKERIIKPHQVTEIEIITRIGSRTGEINNTVTIFYETLQQSEDHNEHQSIINIEVVGEILPDYEYTPKVIYTNSKDNHKLTVTVKESSLFENLELLDAYSNRDYIAIEGFSRIDQASWAVHLEYQPNAVTSMLSAGGEITIVTNSPRQKLIRVPVHIQGDTNIFK